MADSIIERAGRAMCAKSVELDMDDGQSWLVLARTALLAIRYPDKRMLDAGITAAENVEDWTSDSFETYRVDNASDMPLPVWQAMIDAALEEK